MTKRQKAAEENRRQEELIELEYDLRLIAYGASGGADLGYEEREGPNLMGNMSPQGFESYLCAISRIWRRDDGVTWWISIHKVAQYETVRSSAEWMHSQGARAGGEWI